MAEPFEGFEPSRSLCRAGITGSKLGAQTLELGAASDSYRTSWAMTTSTQR